VLVKIYCKKVWDLPESPMQKCDYSKAVCYFITICVKDKHKMLGGIVGDDAHIVPPQYGDIVDKYIKNINGSYLDVFVDKYVIMPNHIHMILVLGKSNGTMWASSPTVTRIPDIIRSLKIVVAKECGFSL
jgi:hypothetical protein